MVLFHKYQKLSEPFIEKFQDKVNWFYISRYQKLSEPFIEKFQEKIGNWFQKPFIEKHKNQKVSEPFNIEKLSEPFIKKFKINLLVYFEYQKLSEPFIEKFQHKVDWKRISTYQKLSESFIEKFQDKVNWKFISVKNDQKIRLVLNWIGFLVLKNYQNLSLKNFKIKLIGLYFNIQNYQNLLLKNIKIKLVGIIFHNIKITIRIFY